MLKEGNTATDSRPEPKSLWNYNFIMVLVFGFLSGTANQMVNPLLSKYAISLGASLSLAGSIVGLQSGMAMFMRPVSGAASDLLNRKFVMIGSIITSSIAFTGYLLFKNIPVVIFCRILQGFAFAFMSVARTAFATEYIPKDRMGEGVAFTSFGVVLSQAVGPAIGLWISEKIGFNGCFIIALICSISGIILLSTLPYKHVRGDFKWNKLKFSNLLAIEVLPYGLIAGLFAMVTHMANAFVPLIGDERGIPNVAVFFTIYSIASLILRPISGKILDKFGLPVLLYPAFFCAAITFILLGAAQSIIVIIIAGIFKSLSQGVALPSIQGSAIKRLGKERAGVSAATIHIGQDLICWIAPSFGGALAASQGYANTFYIYAGIILLGLPCYILIRHFEKKREIGNIQ